MEREDFVTALVNMSKTNQISLPLAGSLLQILPRFAIAVALGILGCLPVTHMFAQTCTKCPTDAQSSAIGDAFDALVVRNGATNRISGGTIGSCEMLILSANVSYNPNGTGGGIGAGFTAGAGRLTFVKKVAPVVSPHVSQL